MVTSYSLMLIPKKHGSDPHQNLALFSYTGTTVLEPLYVYKLYNNSTRPQSRDGDASGVS